MPSACAALLHDGAIDVGLIPSIEYLRGPAARYLHRPDLAIASRGPVASVALLHDAADIATSVRSRSTPARAPRWRWCACCARRLFDISAEIEPRGRICRHARRGATRR